MSPETPVLPQKNSTELLSEQVELLQQQNKQISDILLQLSNILGALSRQPEPPRLTQVRITDFNMPFMALVGLLIKIALAAIPAMIIIGICYFLMALVLGGFIGVLFRR